MEQKQLINLVSRLGFLMLECGAEVYRVEQSVNYICKAYGAKQIDVFAVPSSLIITLSDQENFITKSKRITSYQTNLHKLDQYNALSREICRQKPEYKEANEKLDLIEAQLPYPLLLQILTYAMTSFFFTLFFGGTLLDAVLAFPIGILLRLLLVFLRRVNSSAFFANLIGGAFTTLCSYGSSLLHFTSNPDKISIAVLMLLVPGVALVNSMRDFIGNDLIAGLIRLADALLTATAIALGVALLLFLLHIDS